MMSTTNVVDRERSNVEHVRDLVTSIAERSTDPDATYEGFRLGLEISLAYLEHASAPGESANPANTGSADLEPKTNKASRVVSVEDKSFPTEWALYQ